MIKQNYFSKKDFILISPLNTTKKITFTSKIAQRNYLNQSSSLPVIKTAKNKKEMESHTSSLFQQTTLPALNSCSSQKFIHNSLVNEAKPKLNKRKRKKFSVRHQLLLNNLYHYDPIQEKVIDKLKKDNSIVLSEDFTLEKYQSNLVIINIHNYNR